MRVHIHAWLKSCQKGSLHVCHTSPSRFLCLMSHPSLLFLEGHLETNPDIMFLTTVSPNSPVLKSQHMRHSALASRSFATWPSQMETQVMSPRSSTRSLLWTMTRRPSTIRATITSLTSRKSHVRTLDCCLNPLLRTFLMIILPFKKENKESMHRKPIARQREKEKRRFCDQCCRVDVKEKLTEQY